MRNGKHDNFQSKLTLAKKDISNITIFWFKLALVKKDIVNMAIFGLK